MPLELGICMGAINFGWGKQKKKEYLIIESEQFRFKEFISDLSGQDIGAHNNNEEDAIGIIRNYLSDKSSAIIPSASVVIKEYNEFKSNLPDLCKVNKWVVDELKFNEYSSLVTTWLTLNKT